MPFANLNGHRLHYQDSGGNGPALVFSHGFLMDADMYAAQVEALRSEFRCITWDQRGFGRTGPATEPFSYWDSARDVLALMSHLQVEHAVLVGLSQGGFLSMRAALLAPARVDGLVLLSTRADLDTQETIDNFKALAKEWSANGHVNVWKPLAEMLIGEGADIAPWVAKWAAMDNSALGWPIDALTQRDDLTSRLAEVTAPTLVLHGTKDSAIDLSHGRALAALFRTVDFVEVPGAGHAPPLTHPQAVNRALRMFLDRHALPKH